MRNVLSNMIFLLALDFAVRNLCWLASQALRRYAQAGVQAPDHRLRQRAFAVEYFVHPVALANHGLQVFGLQALLLHAELDGFHRVRQVHREMALLERLHQGYQHIQAVALGRVHVRVKFHQRRDFPECGLVIALGTNRSVVYGQMGVTLACSRRPMGGKCYI